MLKENEIKVGDTHSALLVEDLKRTQIVQYAGASGDYNPLHTDEIFTTQIAGYPSVFAHGMLSMGLTGTMLTDYVGDGSKGTEDRSITSKELADIREKEQRDAGKILGLKAIEFLGYPDGYLEPNLDVRRDISREIRKYKPSVLITTNPNRDLLNSSYLGHPDHFAAGEAALSAVFPSARDHLAFP